MELTYSRGATIQIGNRDFDKLFMGAKDDVPKEKAKEHYKFMKEFVDKELEDSATAIRNDLIIKQLKDKCRIRHKDGKPYVSVTSVNAFADGFPDFPPGYDARGTIVHAYMERWALEGVKGRFNMKDLMKDFPELMPEFARAAEYEINILDCRADAVIEKLEGLNIEFLHMEKDVYNDTLFYSGQADVIGKIDGEWAIIDYKTGQSWDKPKMRKYFKQLAAYANTDTVKEITGGEPITKLVIIPLDTKLVKPKPLIINDKVKEHFAMFKETRRKFKDTYKI